MVRPVGEVVQESTPSSIEVDGGGRFEFGENWRRFLDVIDEGRIAHLVVSGVMG